MAHKLTFLKERKVLVVDFQAREKPSVWIKEILYKNEVILRKGKSKRTYTLREQLGPCEYRATWEE